MGFRQESYTTFDEGREDQIDVSVIVVAGVLGLDLRLNVQPAPEGSATGKFLIFHIYKNITLNTYSVQWDI